MMSESKYRKFYFVNRRKFKKLKKKWIILEPINIKIQQDESSITIESDLATMLITIKTKHKPRYEYLVPISKSFKPLSEKIKVFVGFNEPFKQKAYPFFESQHDMIKWKLKND